MSPPDARLGPGRVRAGLWGCPVISVEDTFSRQHVRFASAEYRFAEAAGGLATHSYCAHTSHGGVADATGVPAPAAAGFAGGRIDVSIGSVAAAPPAGERAPSPAGRAATTTAFAARQSAASPCRIPASARRASSRGSDRLRALSDRPAHRAQSPSRCCRRHSRPRSTRERRDGCLRGTSKDARGCDDGVRGAFELEKFSRRADA